MQEIDKRRVSRTSRKLEGKCQPKEGNEIMKETDLEKKEGRTE